MRAIVHCDWPLAVPTEFGRPVVIHVDCRKQTPKQPGEFDVLYLCEPEPILPAMTRYARSHLALFDLVVVSTDGLLGASPKIVPLEYGTNWISGDTGIPAKRPGISMVVGRKRRTKGHRLRHAIWWRQDEIRGPKQFFTSEYGQARKLAWLRGDSLPANPWGWPTLGDSKLPLFESQFHIAIENCRSRYYFSEKLIDCFITDTVPIYWGCRNIDDYFDTRGIIACETLGQLLMACNTATDELYQRMATARDKNRELASHYLDLGSRLGALIAARLPV